MSEANLTAAPTGRARPRDVLALTTLWVPVGVVLITAAVWWDFLPVALPRQWNSDGISSTSPTGLMFGVLVALTLVPAIGAVFAMPSGAAPNRRTIFLAAGFAAGLAGGAWLFSAGITVLPGADPSNPGGWPLLVLLCAGYGAIAYFIAHKWEEPPRGDNSDDDVALSDPAESAAAEAERLAAVVNGRAEWTSSIASPVFTGLFIAVAVATVGFVVLPALTRGFETADTVLISVTGFVLVFIAMFARIRVRIDAHGLSVRSQFLGVPLKIVRLADITEAHTDYLEPLRWGGWGYRITRGRSAVILRAGPGLVVTRRNGTLFAVSVTAPEVPAALLESLRARR